MVSDIKNLIVLTEKDIEKIQSGKEVKLKMRDGTIIQIVSHETFNRLMEMGGE